MPVPNRLDVANIRESFGRVVYSHKTHEKAREIEGAKATAVKWFNIALTSLTAGSVFSALTTDEHVLLIISAVISTASVAFVVFQLSFDPRLAEERHRTTANRLWLIREQYQVLLVDLMRGTATPEALRARRDALIEDLDVVYSQAPNTTSRAYKRAQEALKVSEDMTFSDAEIDRFLPSAMHVATDHSDSPSSRP